MQNNVMWLHSAINLQCREAPFLSFKLLLQARNCNTVWILASYSWVVDSCIAEASHKNKQTKLHLLKL